jgi:hypothetical protein
MLREHAEMMQDAFVLASKMVRTKAVPARFYRQPEEATAAILYGAELGLKPIQSLQRVVTIHGMPSLEARTMVGLLKPQGYGFRTFEQSDKVVEVWGWEPTSPKVYGTDPDDKVNYGQRIRPDSTSRWTIERATQAGYVPTTDPATGRYRLNGNGKLIGNEKYITDPQAMLKAKAQAEVCRELAPDVLMGISYSREELESEDPRQFDNREPAAPKSAPVTVDEIFAEEVPLSTEDPDNPTDNPRPAAEQATAAQETSEEAPAPDTTETPAGDAETPTQTVDPSPAAPEPDPVQRAEQLVGESMKIADVVTSGPTGDPEFDKAHAEMTAAKQSVADKAAKATSKTIAGKRNTAPAADPDRPKGRMRKALEKRLYALLGDAGYGDDANRDGKIALYRAILERDDVNSTDDLDDVAVGAVADKLYSWQQQNALVDEADAAVARAVAGETTAPAPADAPTSEGNE